MKLSKNFNLEEFTISQMAMRKGISNKPSQQAIENLTKLCKNILQPIRDNFGPVVISSGYRAPKLNVAIGGSKTSQHCKGEAADFTVPGTDNKTLAQWIEWNLNFDQLILEFYPGGWVHCSYTDNYRKSVLRAVKEHGKTKYYNGLA